MAIIVFQFRRPEILQKDLHCLHVNHNDPYLKLGPFKFELKHLDPEIAIIHDFSCPEEIEKVKNHARGKMRSTPYQFGRTTKDFSYLRNSKVMYQNDKIVNHSKAISQRIEWATELKLRHEIFASENFQVMNYGIGGKISPHVDAFGEKFSKDSIGKLMF